LGIGEFMNILVSNDDGIYAPGIMALVRALSKEAKVYVCAPDDQRSASGHSISIAKLIEITEIPFENATRAFSISGTPADCVKLGLKYLDTLGVEIDMVFSGINHGGNLGTDTLYSGTVSAALEGCICGKPSVAISLNSHFGKDFSLAGNIAAEALRKTFGKLDAKTVLNINVPDLPEEEIKGVRVTRLGEREYDEWFMSEEGEDGITRYKYSGKPVIYDELSQDIDVLAMQEGYITITPLRYDLTNHDLIKEVISWKIKDYSNEHI
jgi:5'-nucleotidase